MSRDLVRAAHVADLQVDYHRQVAEDLAIALLPVELTEWLAGLAVRRRRPCVVPVAGRVLGVEPCGEPVTHENPDGNFVCAAHAAPGAVDRMPLGWTGPTTCFMPGTPGRPRPTGGTP